MKDFKSWFTKEGLTTYLWSFDKLFVAPVLIKIAHILTQLGFIVFALQQTFTQTWRFFLLIIPGVFVIRFYAEMVMAIFSINNNIAKLK